jgi:uncharacterized protein DUF4412
MKAFTLLALAALGAVSALADLSYTTTEKTTGGTLAVFASAADNRTTKYFLKGKKMKVDKGDNALILDFDAQTITTINHTAKTVSVKGLDDASAAATGPDVKIDVKETGQKKTINGFSASEIVITVEMEQAGRGGGSFMKMQTEMDLWISPDPPGAGELRSFYMRNASRFPYEAIFGGDAKWAEMQKKLAAMNGVQVKMVVRTKSVAGGVSTGGAAGMPPMSDAQMAQLAQARAQLEQMAKSGVPTAAMVEQQLARMPGGTSAAANSTMLPGVMVEFTSDSTGFSTSSIPDSVFQIPADYEKI